MSYRVYQYGCRPPTAGLEQAEQQMRLRVQFWNRLVEIERAHLESIEQVLATMTPGAEASARPPRDPGRDALVAYQTARREAFRRDDVREQLAVFDAGRKLSVKQAAADSGLWWCNYDDVLQAYQTARRRPGDLQFHSWRRARGKVSVRYQTGLAVALASGNDTRFQLDPLPSSTWERRRHSGQMRTVARIRVGSEGRAPIWLELPIVQHRPLPAGGVIRQVSVTRDRIGTHDRWLLQVVVDEPETHASAPNGPTIAINLGWRVRPHGLRVAYWRDASGQHGELVLPQRWLDQMLKVNEIRSIRDTNFNAARDTLGAGLGTMAPPAWLVEATATLRQWHSPSRLASLAIRWRSERFDGDAEVFEPLQAWQSRDRHLYEYEANTRDQLLAERKNLYRVFAAQVAARQPRSLRLHEFDLSQIAQSDDLQTIVQRNRTYAAVSTLRLALQHSCGRAGSAVLAVPTGTPITQTCAACQDRQRFDAAASLEHTCTACGVRWDQDDNATKNILGWAPPPSKTDDSPPEIGGIAAG